MNSTYRTLSTVHAGLAALALAVASPASWADDHDDDDEDEIPFAEANIFFELNNTDGDLGIHALIDGEGWKNLRIEDPKERKMLLIWVAGRLRRQGLTEIFFESAEPTFDELAPRRFFRRFPAGDYEIEGTTLDGLELESETELTHVMPAPPAAMVNGIAFADQCDDEEPGHNPTEIDINVVDEVTISWPPVTMSHPDADGGGAGVQPPVPVTIENYEVVVEVEAEDNGDSYESVFSVKLPHWVNSLTIPEEFLDQGDEFKYEVLAREESFNQTALESCFVLVE